MAKDLSRLLDRHKLLQLAIADSAITKADLQVLGVLESHANHREQFAAWPSLKKIVAITGLTRETVIRSIRKLAEHGFITVMKHGRKNVYFLELDSPQQVTRKSPIDDSFDIQFLPIEFAKVTNDEAIGNQKPVEIGDKSVTPIKQLDIKNSVKELCPSSEDQEQQLREQKAKAEREPLAEEEQEARDLDRRRDSLRAEFMSARETHPKHAAYMLKTFTKNLHDLAEQTA
jgi:DNA-binding transcriptional MocR family regulator